MKTKLLFITLLALSVVAVSCSREVSSTETRDYSTAITEDGTTINIYAKGVASICPRIGVWQNLTPEETVSLNRKAPTVIISDTRHPLFYILDDTIKVSTKGKKLKIRAKTPFTRENYILVKGNEYKLYKLKYTE